MDTYWPDSTLADLLDIHVQNYEQDFRDYWHLDEAECPEEMSEDDWRLVRLLDRVGAQLVKSAHMLRISADLQKLVESHKPFEDPLKLASSLVSYNVAQARAEIDLASAAVGKLFEGKRRLTFVLALLSQFDLSERATAYIDRMIQCYIWGLDTECVVMARSVIEAALEEVISHDEMTSLGFRGRRKGFALWEYQSAAAKTRRLSDKAMEWVEAIRQAGNEAVHAVPGLHGDSTVTLAQTVVCLRELFPAP